jgi:hypothetical protein
MWLPGSSKKSVNNYQHTQRNNPEQQKPQTLEYLTTYKLLRFVVITEYLLRSPKISPSKSYKEPKNISQLQFRRN